MTDAQWKRALVLYESVSYLPPEAAQARLDSSGEEPAILREVKLMLEADQELQDPLPPPAVEEHPCHEGAVIGRYDVGRRIGQGSTGDVYAGHDRELLRPVALKFVSPEYAGIGSVSEKFIREARVASALNHPNIVTVHEVITWNSCPVIVMELVDGGTLRSLLSAPLPVGQAMDIGRQLLRALAFAHGREVVHRDLKPENIIVRQDGLVKLLDMGLARRKFKDAEHLNASSTAGLPVGTLRYMSPEQCHGMPATAASDVFAAGIVLYEMLGGRHPFHADSPIETAHAIVRSEPAPVRRWRPEVPPAIELLIGRMLNKEAAARPSAQEVLDALAATTPDQAAPVHPAPRARTWPVVWLLAAVGVLGLAGYLSFYLAGSRSEPVRLVDTAIDLGPGESVGENGFALSPDGQTLMFRTGNRLRYVVLSARGPNEWMEGAYPFWSPDGKEVGYHWNGKMWRRGFPNGVAREICDVAAMPLAASWGPGGVILFSSGHGPIFKVSAEGGTPVALTKLEPGEAFHQAPSFLPGGSHFVFFKSTGSPTGRLMLGSTDGSTPPQELTESSSSAVFVPRPRSTEGILVFARNGALLTQPFDSAGNRITGKTAVLTNRARDRWRVIIFASAASNGALAYTEEADTRDQAKIFDREGRMIAKFGELREYTWAVPSPDYTQIALAWKEAGTRESQVGVYDRRTQQTHVVSEVRPAGFPVWSPDSTRLVVSSNEKVAAGDLYTIFLPPGRKAPERLPKPPLPVWPVDWSRDGRFVLVALSAPVAKTDLWTVPIDPGGTPQAIMSAPVDHQGHLSKDGRLLAYRIEEAGESEVRVVPFPPDGRKWQISTGGGQEPRWRSDGKELFYLSLDYALMSVKVGGTALEPSFSRPTRLFGGSSSEPALAVWRGEPSPDGKEFVVLTFPVNPPRPPLRLRLNWWAGQQ